jgi:hypothetical protein
MKKKIQKPKKISKKAKLYFLSVCDSKGKQQHLLHSTNYDSLLVEGMDLAKEVKGTWTIFDSWGRQIDGNIVASY